LARSLACLSFSGGGVSFRVLQAGIITVAEAPNFYNPINRRYEITLPVQATTAGIAGNLTSGQITAGAPLGLNVTNMASTFVVQLEKIIKSSLQEL
jgi:hypothetical protein